MTKHYFEEIMRESKRHVVSNVALGATQGYPYSITLEKPGAKPVLLLRFALSPAPEKPCTDALKAAAIPHVAWFVDGDTIAGTITPPSDFYTKGDLLSALTGAVKVFKSTNSSPPEKCPLCGLTGCDTYAFLDETARPTHKACLNTRLTLPEENTTHSAIPKGSYLTGILGALIGALVGASPNLAQVIGKGVLSAVLYAFIPIFSALLYRLFRGKQRRTFAGLCILIASFAAAFLLELLGYRAYLTAEWGISVSFILGVQTYFKHIPLLVGLHKMLFALLFIVVGIFPAARLLRGYAGRNEQQTQTIYGAAFTRASATPITKSDENIENRN